MSDKHELDNMIFQLENKTDLEKTIFTKKALLEVLGYLKENSQLRSQLEELEKEQNIYYKMCEILYDEKNDLLNRIIVANKNQNCDIWYSIYDKHTFNEFKQEAEEALRKLEEK